jgi:hypothetical protein
MTQADRDRLVASKEAKKKLITQKQQPRNWESPKGTARYAAEVEVASPSTHTMHFLIIVRYRAKWFTLGS